MGGMANPIIIQAWACNVVLFLIEQLLRFVKNGGAFLMSVDSAVFKFYHFEEGKCMLWEEKK